MTEQLRKLLEGAPIEPGEPLTAERLLRLREEVQVSFRELPHLLHFTEDTA